MKQLCICGFISWLWIFLGSTLHGQLLISKTTIDYICHFLKYNKKAKYMGFWAAAYILKVQTWYSNVVKRSCLARMSLNGFFRARFHRYSVWQTHLRDLSSFLILFYFFLIQEISFAQANMRYVLKFLYLCVNADKTREGGLKAGKCFSSVSLKTYRRLLFLQRCMGRQVLPLKCQAVYND